MGAVSRSQGLANLGGKKKKVSVCDKTTILSSLKLLEGKKSESDRTSLGGDTLPVGEIPRMFAC